MMEGVSRLTDIYTSVSTTEDYIDLNADQHGDAVSQYA